METENLSLFHVARFVRGYIVILHSGGYQAAGAATYKTYKPIKNVARFVRGYRGEKYEISAWVSTR